MTVQGQVGVNKRMERLLTQVLDTVLVLVDAPVALGFTVDEHQTLARIVPRCADGADERAAATLVALLPALEPIDPFSPRRADAARAAVLSAADAGGYARVAASMYGRRLRRHGWAPPVFMYFRRDGRIESGIALLRSVDAPPFDARAVRVVCELQPFLESALTMPAGRDVTLDAPDIPTLTGREAEVAALVADGASNAGVASALGMSEATVKTHLTKVYVKLGVRTRTQLALMLPRAQLADVQAVVART